jgi:putative SOS response-associated peptidase YedK
MCGRFSLTSTPESLAERFDLEETPECAPRYNIAPGQDVLAVRADDAGTRRAEPLRWGLVPSWAESPAVGHRMINARSETAASKPAFRDAFVARRCIVPANGFYEWADHGGFRQPYWIAPRDGEPFGFAGLWECWRGADGAMLETCTLLTTQANARLAALHARMPVILPREADSDWLDASRAPDDLAPLLRPLADDALDFHAVGTRVNKVEFDDASLQERVAAAPRQPTLF